MVFGISGFKGSGKDEFYKTLIELDNSYKKLAFADPIKNEVIKIFNLKDEDEYDTFKRSTISYNGIEIDARHVVREIGMLMRSYNSNQFVEYVYGNMTRNTCVTDVRFANEIALFERLKRTDEGVYLIKIKRYNSEDNHITERDFSDNLYDYVIENNGTLEEFKSKVKEIYNELKDKNKC